MINSISRSGIFPILNCLKEPNRRSNIALLACAIIAIGAYALFKASRRPTEPFIKPKVKPSNLIIKESLSEKTNAIDVAAAEKAFRDEMKKKPCDFELVYKGFNHETQMHSARLSGSTEVLSDQAAQTATALFLLLYLASRNHEAKEQLYRCFSAISSISLLQGEELLTLLDFFPLLGKYRGEDSSWEIDYGWILGMLNSELSPEGLCRIFNLIEPESDELFKDLDSIQRQYMLFYAAFIASGQCYRDFCQQFSLETNPQLKRIDAKTFSFQFKDLEVIEPENLPKTPARPRNPRLSIAPFSMARYVSPGMTQLLEWLTPTKGPLSKSAAPPATPLKK